MVSCVWLRFSHWYWFFPIVFGLHDLPKDMALRNLIVLDKKEAIECLYKNQVSLEEKIKGYTELEKYIIDKHGHLSNNQLSKRRIYMLESEMKWLKKFTKDFISCH